MALKKLIITSIACFIAIMAKGQIAWNYAKYDIGFSGASNTAYTDAETMKSTTALHLNFTYNHTPFVNYITELQLGHLAGGDHVNTLSGREFKNKYTALTFRAQLQAGELINYESSTIANVFKNLYGSAGIGVIYNNMEEIYRSSLYIEDYISGGQDKSSEFFVPLKVGYEFKLYNKYDEPSFKIDLGYQYNYVFGDQLDGIVAGQRKDSYSQLVLGLKFSFGEITSYRKQISRYHY